MTNDALSYFGHVLGAGGMEDDMMLGRMNGERKRGRPRQRWLDLLKGYASGATISNMRRDVIDRAGCRGAATAVARGRMRLECDNIISSVRISEFPINERPVPI